MMTKHSRSSTKSIRNLQKQLIHPFFATKERFSEVLSYFLPDYLERVRTEIITFFGTLLDDTIQLGEVNSLRDNNFPLLQSPAAKFTRNWIVVVQQHKFYDFICSAKRQHYFITISVGNKVDELLNGTNERHKIQMFTCSPESETHWAEVFIDADKLRLCLSFSLCLSKLFWNTS